MDSIPSQLLLQIILILLNAFFAATEIAVLSLNKTQLEKKAENGENGEGGHRFGKSGEDLYIPVPSGAERSYSRMMT